MNELHMAHTGFKAYDIRGVIPDEINEELAYRVGRAYAELYHPKAPGHDPHAADHYPADLCRD